MRLVGVSVAVTGLLAASAGGQTADVRIRGDLSIGLVDPAGGQSGLRAISLLGRFSTIGLDFRFPAGLRGYLSQRIEVLRGDPDDEDLDEYFIEDPGSWRVGKQYVPFGTGQLLRESLTGIRGDSRFLFEGLPVTVAAVDDPQARHRAFYARLGSRSFGFSLATGRGIGSNGTALASVRPYRDRSLLGAGWRRAYGFDLTSRRGSTVTQFEALQLDGPATGEASLAVLELTTTLNAKRHSYQLAISKIADGSPTWFRFSSQIYAQRGFWVEPMLRFRGGLLAETAIMARVKF